MGTVGPEHHPLVPPSVFALCLIRHFWIPLDDAQHLCMLPPDRLSLANVKENDDLFCLFLLRLL